MEAVNNNMQQEENVKTSLEPESFWIFGYGSLCWNPGFEFQHSVTGYVKGFSRRFWQGNTKHRGTESNPGRVATLIEDVDGITWGRAFLVSSQDTAALPYLSNRECQLGGYKQYTVPFYPKQINNNLTILNSNLTPSNSNLTPSNSNLTTLNSNLTPSNSRLTPKIDFKAYLYIATPENEHWLGHAPLTDIANQILECYGPAGSNAEYLLKLANFMRLEIPEALDEHLFSLERLVKMFAVERKICLRTLMGDDVLPKPAKSNDFASRVPEKQLRCVRM